MKIYIYWFLFFFILAHAPLHTIAPCLKIPTQKLSLTDCLKPRNLNFHIMHTSDIQEVSALKILLARMHHVSPIVSTEKPSLTDCYKLHKPIPGIINRNSETAFQEYNALRLKLSCHSALRKVLATYQYGQAVFDKQYAQWSKQWDEQFVAGQVDVTAGDQDVSDDTLKLVTACAQQMGCHERILVMSSSSNDGLGMCVHTDLKDNKVTSHRLFLNLGQLGNLGLVALEPSIKHELIHIKERHELVKRSLIPIKHMIDAFEKKDGSYAGLLRSYEQQADIGALLTSPEIIPAAKRMRFNDYYYDESDRGLLLSDSDDVVQCKKKKCIGGKISYDVIIKRADGSYEQRTLPYKDSFGNAHPFPLERVAYMIDLERAWDAYRGVNQKAGTVKQSNQRSS